MIFATLIALGASLSNYLRLSFKLSGDIVSLYPLAATGQSAPTNKVHLSLVNLERETAAGVRFNHQSVAGNQYKQTAPQWRLNVYVMIAAVFSEKRYEESLQLLSGVLFFLQANNSFSVPKTNTVLSIEPVNLSFHELSNLWGICGGTYYPSVLCKIRVLNIDNDEIKNIIGRVSQAEKSYEQG